MTRVIDDAFVAPGVSSTQRFALHRWLDRAADLAPEQAALETPQCRLTYRELREEVRAAANMLLEGGLVPGDRLGIAATRSAQTVVWILAAVQSGVGYVPFDLSYPAQRLRAMLDDARPRAVVGDAAAIERLKSLVGTFPSLDVVADAAFEEPGASSIYVLYTSGSTGAPKGVAMGEAPLRHLIEFHHRHPRLGVAARTLQFAPLSFDVHFQEIFSTIACVGTLVMLEESTRHDPVLLLQAMLTHRIERLFLPYVALQMLAQAAHDTVPRFLQHVVSAGEQLQVTPAIRAMFAAVPGAELHNHYGPTETHVVTAYELTGDPQEWPQIPPIGRPLPHVQLAIRPHAKHAEIEIGSGELLIGGETLAHGYLHRPDLTAERFRDDVAGRPGRWYCTGDLVQCDADGVYTYLGRADTQVKVDGFRIEPGEVELALMAEASVKDAVVIAPEIPGAGRQLVAYVVRSNGAGDAASLSAQWRRALRERLPDYMVPARFVLLERLPVTPSGKIDRKALPIPQGAPHIAAADAASLAKQLWHELLGLDRIAADANLFELGARSLLVLRFIARMKESGFDALSVTDVYDRPTLAGIAAALREPARRVAKRQRPRPAATAGVAIVGMATRTAGAANLEQFWRSLVEQREGIRQFAPHEIDPSVPESIRSRPNFVAARGVLENVGRFDAAFFGVPSREATMLDPQQRLLLELSWSALEHAGIDPTHAGSIGVYAGTGNNAYIAALRQERPELVQQYGEFATMLASEKDYVATRIAHRLGLTGPAVSVHTACSTGLVAVAQAWHALASGQCDVAIAGGASVVVPQEGGYLHVEGAMESADGHCRPFDAEASGTVFASAGAAVVLKRLEDAQRDGDIIFAVIRGVGLNNDGADKASFTAPSVEGQAQAIRMALDHAQLDARTIGYVEAHGTATVLGDPIEVAALTRAWRSDTDDRQFAVLGSVKGNLGHTVAAAGVLGLIKAALSLHYELIPGTLHFHRPNPQIEFEQTPFRVVAQNTPWARGQMPRRAAVSSFGVGGTNAHVVIEEAPAVLARDRSDNAPLLVLPLSGHDHAAALARAQSLAEYLEAHPEQPLDEVVATLVQGRKALASRVAVVARDPMQAAAALRCVKAATRARVAPRLVFLFPGQGSQHPGMARGLYDEAPVFREALDRCFAAAGALGADLKTWLVDADPADVDIASCLADTRHAQPALFSMSYALATWLDSLGLSPDAMIGHSIGELAAACHASVFTPEDAMSLVVARGQAIGAQPRGAMLAARAGVQALSDLPSDVEVAGVNAPNLTVLAGPAEAINRLMQVLETRGVDSTRLKVSHAFHSAAMDGALSLVAAAASQVQRNAPSVPVYSGVTGSPLSPEQAMDPKYWAMQVRCPVRFSEALTAELAHVDTVFIEVGPSQALTALMRQHRTPTGEVAPVVALLAAASSASDPAMHAAEALSSLWRLGAPLRWPVTPGTRRATLPTYPFAGENHWFARRPTSVRSSSTLPAAVLEFSADAFVEAHPASAIVTSRLPVLQQEIKRILEDVSGLPAAELTGDATFVDQGLDSLSLTQATLEIERVFGQKLRFRRLMEDLDTVDKLSAFLHADLPADRFTPATTSSEPAVQVAAVAPVALPLAAANGSALQQLIQQQMQLMAQQLALLSGASAVQQAPTVKPAVTVAAPKIEEPEQPTGKALIDKPFGASARITLDSRHDFTPAQSHWLDDFIARYNAKSAGSKAFSQQHRARMADPRVVTGFNPLWKDLVYPIVVNRSKGSKLWDVDGNEYIDLLSCFGANLLGYQPDSLRDAMVEQLHAGIEVGPQHPLAAEVAELISEFTGLERVAFCNTGSEAVMGAMRIARTVTGRKTIAIFNNSYHGIFDEVIVRGTKQLRSLSAAPGILSNSVENILVLDWNSEESLSVLRERGHELAAIMSEPIQNKCPTIQPREFVQSLRRIADEAGCALIFDEVVTGFRVAPGGAQEFYGVRADMATFGKVIGGGLPFAAIAGGARWLDALDGGHWQYGDDSYPEAGVTYFAGTFVRHPLALAAARASLLHLKKAGRGLYRELNDRTQRLIDRLNTAFTVRGAPVKAVHCASLWRLSWDDNIRFVSLFYYLARFHGLHLYEQFGHFMTEGFSDADTDRIFEVFTNALDELMALGLIQPRNGRKPPGGGGTRDKQRDNPSGTSLAVTSSSATTGPLSPGQTERWLAGSFDAHARRALNESLCVSLEGDVDEPALLAALQDVLQRHDAFRIQFDLESPQQSLVAVKPLPIDVRDLPGTDANAALDAFCCEASQHEFALDIAPLAKFTLLRLSDGRRVVHVVTSHLIFDGWASSVFNTELAQAYRTRCRGEVAQWPVAGSPIAFAAAEQARFEGPDGKEALSFWSHVLRAPPAPLQLGDLTPAHPRRYAADTRRSSFEATTLQALRQQARKSGATLFQLLLTAVASALRQLSGQSDFVVSVPFASQSLERRGPLMADGVLDLPLRLRCESQQAPDDLLRDVRSRLLDALEYPLMTQGTVARALGIRSQGDRPPLTGIFFNLNPRVDLSGYAPLVATMHEGRKRGTLNDLFFNFYEQDDALTLDLHYSSEWFSPGRAAVVIEALVAKVNQYAVSLASEIGDVRSTLDPRLLQWNATAAALEPGARVEAWVSRQVALTPSAVAVVAKDGTLTYADLETRANRIANALRERGVKAGDRVGICLERGVHMVPALLGVLKAGAAYVPLDPGFPADRLRYMAEDAAVRIVITESRHAALSGVERAQQLRVDDDAALIAEASDSTSADKPVDEDAPAYVIYTSGSTGKPKGVAVTQRGVCNFLASMRREPGLAATHRLLAVTTLSFDIAVLELFLPLVVGARVVIAKRDEGMDAQAMARLLEGHRIDVMQATPTAWHLLLDTGWRAPAGFRALCGGEPLPPSLAARLIGSGVELWNMYGPTETTVWSTLERIYDANQAITIGRPIGNTQVWVVDESLRPCAIGVEGEICIGGDGVAAGYFKRPELTAERFVDDPFASWPGRKLYRTGDLGRWREDGRLDHLGRLDFQVKIRGYRIELGEIEAQLAAFPGVARSVVMACEESGSEVRLVGYVVMRNGAAVDAAAMRHAVRSKLPDYMVPQHIVRIDTMPLLPNGKIDRKALPKLSEPGGNTVVETAIAFTPRDEIDRIVVEAMQAVLQVGGIDRDDDFFRLGGHSLLAAKLIARLNRELGLQMSLRVLFEAPTVQSLADAIRAERDDGAAVQRAPIVRRADQHVAPVTVMQERIHLVESMGGSHVGYNAPSAHRFKGEMNVVAFGRAFHEVVARQEALRTAIASESSGAKPVQRIIEPTERDLLPVEDLSSLQASEREATLTRRLDQLTGHRFTLSQAPLFTAALFKLADDDHALFFMPHHVVWDGWSFDIFYAEMSSLYEAFCHGAVSPLPELPVTYGDYAQWHETWMRSDEIRAQLDHWVKLMGRYPASRAPATDWPRESASAARGDTEFMLLPFELTEQMREVARRTGSTMSIVALAVYAALMSQWIDDPVPAIGLPVRGRPTPDVENVMGFFNNMLPLRLPVDEGLSFIDWVKVVRVCVTEAFANQDVPFELLAQHMTSTSNRLYQVMFSFQDARQRQTHWGNLSHSRIPLMHKGATEDLNLWMIEVPGGIEAGLQYNAELFSRATVASLRDRYVALLNLVIADASKPLRAMLAMASPAQVATLTNAAAFANDDVFSRIDRRLREAAWRVALCHGGNEWSGASLAARVDDAVARWREILAQQNVRRVVVLASGDASVQLVAALAAWRIGVDVLALDADVDDATLGVRLAAPEVAAVVSDANDGMPLPASVRRVDAKLFGGTGQIAASTRIRGAAPTLPMDRAAMSALALRFSNLLDLADGDRVHWVEGDCAAQFLLQAVAALGSGASVHVLDAAEAADGNRLAARLRADDSRTLYASGAAEHLVNFADELAAGFTAQLDVTRSTPQRVEPWLARGCRVLTMMRPETLGLSLAAGFVTESREAATFGHPWPDAVVALLGRDDESLPMGVPGLLTFSRLPGRLPDIATGKRARIRHDGILQWLDASLAGATGSAGAAATAATPRAMQAVHAARTPAERIIAEIWSQVIGVPDLGIDQNFFDVGGGSMMALQVMALIEERLSVRLPLTALIDAPTIRALAAVIAPSSTHDTLVTLRAGGDKAPVFFIHDGAGEVLLYRSLALKLAAGHPVYGLRPLTRDGCPMVHTRIEEMAAHYLRRIREAQPTGPYLLAGLCAGGVIAFEVALQLQAQGEKAAMIALLDAADVKAQTRPYLMTERRVRRLAAAFRADDGRITLAAAIYGLGAAVGKARNTVVYEIRKRVRAWRIDRQAQTLRRRIDTDNSLSPLSTPLTVREIYKFAERDYCPQGCLSGDVVLFRSTRSTGESGDDPFIDMYVDPAFGWQPRITGKVHCVDLPGGHASMLQEPYVQSMAERMNERLECALVQKSGGAPRAENSDTDLLVPDALCRDVSTALV